MSSVGIAPNSLTIRAAYFLVGTSPAANSAVSLSFHSLYSAFVSPTFFSYGRTLYTQRIRRSPYSTALTSERSMGRVILNPGFFSMPLNDMEMTGICDIFALLSARRIMAM